MKGKHDSAEGRPSMSDLLAARDGDPLDAAIAAAIRSDPEAQSQIDVMRDIQAKLRALPHRSTPPADAWQKIEARIQKRAENRTSTSRGFRAGRWLRMWPVGLVASAGLLAGIFLAGGPVPEPRSSATRASLVALQKQSRILEAQLMRTSSYAGTPSEQALMFRLADVDAELAQLGTDDSATSLAARESLWRRRIELMQALQAVQPPTEPTVQHAVY